MNSSFTHGVDVVVSMVLHETDNIKFVMRINVLIELHFLSQEKTWDTSCIIFVSLITWVCSHGKTLHL